MSTASLPSETTQADEIINELKKKAAAILSASLGSGELEAFNTGSKGNMPYYWSDPRNLEFNPKTYQWINSALKAGGKPVELDQSFPNLYINVLSKVGYSLSTDDQAKLNDAKANATNQQGAVLSAWKASFGSLPAGDGQPIDLIATEIATKWANPATTLQDIQNSINPGELLNKIPASGGPVVPVFANWLNALGASVSLVNNTTMNNAYLKRALAAVQSPTANNGGLKLSGEKELVPDYKVATPLAQIINGLKNSSQAASMSMTVVRTTESEFQVTASGGASFSIPVFDLFSIDAGGNASYFQSDIATTDNETTVDMTFPGVTLVNFGPAEFEKSGSSTDWYWTQPIKDAIQNGKSDVSGFKFNPQPQIDFSAGGPFGFLSGVAISNYPTITITVKSSSYERIQKTFQQSASVGVTFLGIPLGIGASESTYSNKVQVDEKNSSVTITLSPPKNLVAGESTDSVGWVLGVQTEFPGA